MTNEAFIVKQRTITAEEARQRLRDYGEPGQLMLFFYHTDDSIDIKPDEPVAEKILACRQPESIVELQIRAPGGQASNEWCKAVFDFLGDVLGVPLAFGYRKAVSSSCVFLVIVQ